MKYSVIAHPWSKRTLVQERKDTNDITIYHVYTTSKPIDGQANVIIIELMAQYLWYKKYQMRLVSWHKSKHKVIEKIDYI